MGCGRFRTESGSLRCWDERCTEQKGNCVEGRKISKFHDEISIAVDVRQHARTHTAEWFAFFSACIQVRVHGILCTHTHTAMTNNNENNNNGESSNMSGKMRTKHRALIHSLLAGCISYARPVRITMATRHTLLTTISEYSIFVDLLCHKWFDKLLCYQQNCLPYKLFRITKSWLFHPSTVPIPPPPRSASRLSSPHDMRHWITLCRTPITHAWFPGLTLSFVGSAHSVKCRGCRLLTSLQSLV